MSSPQGLPLGLMLYRGFTFLAAPAARLILRSRAARGKEDEARLPERLGFSGKPRPAGRLVWIHGASVGESLAALPLIEKLLYDGNVLVTSGTVASANVMSRRLPVSVIHQYVPLDTQKAVNRFLDHWKPDAALFVESEIWPNFIWRARALGKPLVLANARLSDRSYPRYKKYSFIFRELFASFSAVGAVATVQASTAALEAQ